MPEQDDTVAGELVQIQALSTVLARNLGSGSSRLTINGIAAMTCLGLELLPSDSPHNHSAGWFLVFTLVVCYEQTFHLAKSFRELVRNREVRGELRFIAYNSGRQIHQQASIGLRP